MLKYKHLIAGEWLGCSEKFSSEPAHGPAHDFAAGCVPTVKHLQISTY